jgi:hypothetical protein
MQFVACVGHRFDAEIGNTPFDRSPHHGRLYRILRPMTGRAKQDVRLVISTRNSVAVLVAQFLLSLISSAGNRMAADQGNAAAQTNIGILYEGGLGVTRDYSEAMRWVPDRRGSGICRGAE